MTSIIILLAAIVLILCVFSDKLSGKIGVPALIIFIGIGMLFGSDGLFKIPFENYNFAATICEVALIVIMFSGGFSVKWNSAKPVAIKACLMSTLGVIITAGITFLFCWLVLGFEVIESFLIGAVISSTDAASVFSILRSKRLNLKNGIAPLLEVESGSNDPFSYMLTVIALALLEGKKTDFVLKLIFSQLLFGVLFGIAVGLIMRRIISRLTGVTDGFECVLFLAAALLAYGLSTLVSGNGYLSVYIVGVILGNSRIPAKKQAVTFLNGISVLCQIIVFFLLGLLATPHDFVNSIVPALLIYLCLTIISRPVAVGILCTKTSIKEKIFVSLAGLRGASSIVFAIMTVISSETEHNVFNTVFLVCMLSMLLQGSVLPLVARKLNLIDDNSDVLKTFNDYQEESALTMIRMLIPEGHSWVGRKICEVEFPVDSLAVIIKRGNESIVPRGNTEICADDSIIISMPPYNENKEFMLREINIDINHCWIGKSIKELQIPDNLLIVLIKRNGESIIPEGSTLIQYGDIVVVTDTKQSYSPEAIICNEG